MTSITLEPSLEISIISARNEETSPLLQLPGELRNRIYDYVFDGVRIAPQKQPLNCIGLLSACRQIHFETALMPYQRFVFVFESIKSLDRRYFESTTPTEFIHNRSNAQRLSIQQVELAILQCVWMWAESGAELSPRAWEFVRKIPNLQKVRLLAIAGALERTQSMVEGFLLSLQPGLVIEWCYPSWEDAMIKELGLSDM